MADTTIDAPKMSDNLTRTGTLPTDQGGGQSITTKLTQALGGAQGKVGPLTDKAKGFAKARPFATAALAGVVGLAFLNTLRGR